MLAFGVLTILSFCNVAFSGNPVVSPEYLQLLRSAGRDDLFAELLGIQDVSLVRATDERSEGPMYSNVSPLGDILLTKEQAEQAEQARQGVNLVRYPSDKWPDHVVPYWIFSDGYTQEQVDQIRNAIEYMSSYLTNIKFRLWQNGDTDYVAIFNGQGCWSVLGRRGGQQPLSIQANGCVVDGIVQHEMMHAIGFLHEHSRADRDYHVTVLEDNIPPEWRSQYQKADYGDFGIQGDYDYYSVMHYGMYAPGTNKLAFEIKANGINTDWVGQRYWPTWGDIWKIDILYTQQSG